MNWLHRPFFSRTTMIFAIAFVTLFVVLYCVQSNSGIFWKLGLIVDIGLVFDLMATWQKRMP